MNRYFFLFLICCSLKVFSQENISGLWIAYKDKNPYYGTLNIKQNNNGLISGTTYDETKTGFCNYELTGKYNANLKLLEASNNKLIKKDPIHLPGIYSLTYSKVGNKEYLTGTWVHNKAYYQLNPNEVVNQKLKSLNKTLQVIYEKSKEPKPDLVNKISDVKPAIKEKVKPEKEISEAEFKKMKNKRKNVFFKSIKSHESEIQIQIRDYDKQDGDKVSIYLDDKIIRYNMLIRSNLMQIPIQLGEKKKKYTLCFAANNLGNIPPNTAYLVIFVDGNTIEKVVLTDDNNNSCIEIEKI